MYHFAFSYIINLRGTTKSGQSSERRRPFIQDKNKTIMNNYADSSNRAASGKNNQPTNQLTNNSSLTLLEAYKRLSSRECEVLVKIEEGKSCPQIADELFLSKKTVENHITNIGKKLNQKGRGNLRKWIRSQKD